MAGPATDEFRKGQCKDAALCADCVRYFIERGIAADRARIAAAIREEMDSSQSSVAVGLSVDPLDLCARLLHVVEGG